MSVDTTDTTCAMCSNESVGCFNYRALNGTYAVEEPLCGVCTALLSRVGSVVSLEPAAEDGPQPDHVSLAPPFTSSRPDGGNDSVG